MTLDTITDRQHAFRLGFAAVAKDPEATPEAPPGVSRAVFLQGVETARAVAAQRGRGALAQVELRRPPKCERCGKRGRGRRVCWICLRRVCPECVRLHTFRGALDGGTHTIECVGCRTEEDAARVAPVPQPVRDAVLSVWGARQLPPDLAAIRHPPFMLAVRRGADARRKGEGMDACPYTVFGNEMGWVYAWRAAWAAGWLDQDMRGEA